MKRKIISSILACAILAYTTPVLALTKEETVYTKLNNNGANYNTIVNNHLINSDNQTLIQDLSDLLNIENTNGTEELEKQGNKLVWKANGNDIYYQGESNKNLPIDCNITYELDGEKIEAKDLAGRSGKVKITMEYTNKDKHTVKINGKSQTMYTPFVTLCGTIINNENNKNIQITNGKVIDNGNKTIVIGISFPGLQESLNISEKTIELPSKVEITMETTSFELGNIITMATPKVLEDGDLSIFNELDAIYAKANTLKTSSNQLVQGANTLKQGTSTYNQKSQEFNKVITNGLTTASTQYNQIDAGINELAKQCKSLPQSSKDLNEGVKAIKSNLTQISSSISKLQTANKTVIDGQTELIKGVDQLIAGVDAIAKQNNTEELTNLSKLIEANITTLTTTNKALQAQLANGTLDEQTKKGLQTQIEQNTKVIEGLKQNLAANKQAISKIEQTQKEQIGTLQAGLQKVKTNLQKLQAGNQGIYENQAKIKTWVDTLDTNMVKLVQGTTTLANSAPKLVEGLQKLQSGSSQMKQGLTQSAKQASQASVQLNKATNEIAQGAKKLSDGMNQFDKQGVQTIYSYINGNLKELTTRVEKLQNLAESYNNFTMLNENTKGNVKFIMITDSIKKEEN